MTADKHIIIDRFAYKGSWKCDCVCRLEIIPLADGRTAVIATELPDNPGTSVTNAAEHLAEEVCRLYEIAAEKLVWIETYGYESPTRTPRTFDLVTFVRPAGRRIPLRPGDRHQEFEQPRWQPMSDAFWRALGLEPRKAYGEL